MSCPSFLSFRICLQKGSQSCSCIGVAKLIGEHRNSLLVAAYVTNRLTSASNLEWIMTRLSTLGVSNVRISIFVVDAPASAFVRS